MTNFNFQTKDEFFICAQQFITGMSVQKESVINALYIYLTGRWAEDTSSYNYPTETTINVLEDQRFYPLDYRLFSLLNAINETTGQIILIRPKNRNQIYHEPYVQSYSDTPAPITVATPYNDKIDFHKPALTDTDVRLKMIRGIGTFSAGEISDSEIADIPDNLKILVIAGALMQFCIFYTMTQSKKAQIEEMYRSAKATVSSLYKGQVTNMGFYNYPSL